ncbi:glutathione S-transferase family protein [Chamaesiphon polymorphus]|uniref:Glutathione S-transferase n=1 Tax=Chamaesiphon polymorphus CCALA 037 TaxID=2107692 RepID=A0A2T1GAX9_9CYAN|nr:glutathione S-transferase family protein [Chamaesiphon polymorphus]PSB54418.1 glutathione S-transferase [Chamaesiphon polymorphus CCALA 037]
MIKLYGGARSRASIVRWYLEELAIPYEFILLDMAGAEHLQPDFLKINPFGKVPAIVDGDFALFESGAILLYLNQKYSKTELSLEQQAIFAQWTLFGNSTLATGIFVEASRERELPKLMPPLEAMLAKHPYLLGDEFSVVDVAVGSMLIYIPLLLKLDLSAYPAVVNYIDRISNRPACKIGMS